MPFSIRITRISEDETIAWYAFDGGEPGTLAVAKATGEITLVEAAPGDEVGHCFRRAASMVRKHWSEGFLPALTQWAP